MEINSDLTSELHDAELYAVRHDPSSSAVECIFRKVDGHDLTLRLGGVVKFRCSDFGLQNVVLELAVIDATRQPARDALRRHLHWMSSASNGENLSNAQEIETAIRNVLDGKYVLVSLVPSWGAQICALAKSIDWE